MGSLAHLYLLQPKLAKDLVVICPSAYSPSEAKKWKSQQKKVNKDCIIISAEDKAILDAMKDSWDNGDNSEEIWAIMSNAQTEVVIIWDEIFHDSKEQKHILRCKGKIDILRPVSKHSFILGDLKTTKDASEHSFANTIEYDKIHMQLAFYRRGIKAFYPRATVAPMIIAIENSKQPYETAIYEFDERDGDLADGDALVDEAMKILLDCKQSGNFPAFTKKRNRIITRPAWAKRRNNGF